MVDELFFINLTLYGWGEGKVRAEIQSRNKRKEKMLERKRELDRGRKGGRQEQRQRGWVLSKDKTIFFIFLIN